jgi:preprotein translocase subunit SecD
VGIFGARLGTPTGEGQSGTIEEIERFRKAGKYVALYFSTADVPRTADRAQLDALESYRKERQRDTLYATFGTARELRDKVTAHVPKIVQEVHAKIQAAEPGQALMQEAEAIRISADTRLAQVARDQTVLIADIISELEDNLAALVKPIVGNTFRKPTSSAWKQNRNNIDLPGELRAKVTKTYQTIDAWADIVGPGLHLGTGSMELNTIFASLPFTLTPLIERLRQFTKQ